MTQTDLSEILKHRYDAKEYFEIQLLLDPFTELPENTNGVFITMYHYEHEDWKIVQFTETIRVENPIHVVPLDFQTLLKQEFIFGTPQRLKLIATATKIKDDGENDNAVNVDLGETEFIVGEILTATFAGKTQSTLNESEGELLKSLKRFQNKNFKWYKGVKVKGSGKVSITLIVPDPWEHVVPRISNKDKSHIIIKDIDHYEEFEAQSMSVTIRLQVEGLKAMNKELKSTDPYFIVYRDGVEFQQKLYQSEVQENSKGIAVYRIFTFGISGTRSLDKPLKIEFCHRQKFIGIFTTNVFELREGKKKFTLFDPDVPNENRGTVTVLKYEERIWLTRLIKKRILCRPPVEVEQYHYLNDFHLLHYLGYHKVHLVLALDFTVSNGPQPTINKKSYHYIGDKSKLNMYEVSMSAVARAIYQYNEQANAKVYGFGIQPDINNNTTFVLYKGTPKGLFERRKTENDPLKTLLSKYRSAVKNVSMGVSNNFEPIITEVSETSNLSHSYYVLVIILDGDKLTPSNLEKTLTAVSQSYRSGMSIVFIGIGKDKFETCLRLQSEFTNVSFCRYVDDQRELGIKALRKIPAQMLDYYASRKEVPEIYRSPKEKS